MRDLMAAILPSGMRAVSTEISAETGRVASFSPTIASMSFWSKREKRHSEDGGGPPEIITSQIILSNVRRVLAIDQAPKEKDGCRGAWQDGHAGIEPEEVENLARARMAGTLSPALRSIARQQEQ